VPEPLAVRITLDGFRVTVGPVGSTELERLTVPAKPLLLLSWTVELPDEPATMTIDDVLRERLKSTTFTMSCTE
jgi:hypothetical protein